LQEQLAPKSDLTPIQINLCGDLLVLPALGGQQKSRGRAAAA